MNKLSLHTPLLHLLHYWRTSKWYWPTIKKITAIQFDVMRSVFRYRFLVRQFFNGLVSVFSIIRSVFWIPALALALSCLLVLIDYVLGQKNSFLTVSSSLRHVLSDLIMSIHIASSFLHHPHFALGKWEFYLPELKVEIVIQVLIAITQVSAVLLAIYFATLGIVASTSYKEASNSLRELALFDSVGNAFVFLNVFLFAISLILLAGIALKISVGLVAFTILLALIICAVGSISKLTYRSFLFFDPTSLIDILNRNFYRWAHAATPVDLFFQKAEFQYYYQREAQTVLGMFSELIDVCLLNQNPAQTRYDLTAGLGRLYQAYCRLKRSIPANSLWFKREQMYPSWLAADYSIAKITLSAGRSLTTETTNNNWAEEYIIKMFSRVIDYEFAQIQNGNDHADYLGYMIGRGQDTVRALAENFMLDEAETWHCMLKDKCIEYAHSIYPATEEVLVNQEKLNHVIALLGFGEMGLSYIMRGFIDALSQINIELAADRIEHPKQLYNLALPRAVITEITNLGDQIKYEIQVEGKRITPVWYARQICAISIGQYLLRSIETLIMHLEKMPLETARFVEEGKIFCTAQLISQTLESCTKGQLLLVEIQKTMTFIEKYYLTDDVSWPQFDLAAHRDRIENVRYEAIAQFAQIAPSLTSTPHSEKYWPDYVGHAYHILCEECIRAIEQGNNSLLERIFPSLFTLSLSAFTWAPDHTHGLTSEQINSIGFDLLIDLLSLSGYARIYSELNSQNCWETVQTIWNQRIQSIENPSQFCSAVAGFVQYDLDNTTLTTRKHARFEWQHRLQRRLRELHFIGGLLNHPFDELPGLEEPESQIIRALSITGLVQDYSSEVFLVTYIFELLVGSAARESWNEDGFAGTFRDIRDQGE